MKGYPAWRRVAASVVAGLMVACSSAPPPPDWAIEARNASERMTEAWLSGNARGEQAEHLQARKAVAATGRFEAVAGLELLRCATRVASLVVEPCAAFEALRVDAPVAQRAYADHLAGRGQAADAALLPAAQRGAVDGVADPLSRLVAAGVLFQKGLASPKVVALAMDTYKVDWTWNSTTGLYERQQNGRADKQGDGSLVTTNNIVVLEMIYAPGISNSPDAQSVGNGQAWVFAAGNMIHGTWTRANKLVPFTLTADDGTPIVLTPGRTFVELPRTGGNVTPK